MALVEPMLTPMESPQTDAPAFLVTVGGPVGQGRRPKSIDDPLPTVLTDDRHAVVEPSLMAISHADKDGVEIQSPSCDQSLGVRTTQSTDDFGVVTINGKKYRLDIKLRMLDPKELAAAHSQESGVFKGSRKDIVKQIGNSVPSGVAESLCSELLARYGDVRNDVVDVDAEIRVLAGQADAERLAAAA
jgi:hypothetical protein